MNSFKTAERQISDTFLNAVFIILSGGFQDAYTYFSRGKVFANAQTGNIVLMAAALFDNDMQKFLGYLIPCFRLLQEYSSQKPFTRVSNTAKKSTGGKACF